MTGGKRPIVYLFSSEEDEDDEVEETDDDDDERSVSSFSLDGSDWRQEGATESDTDDDNEEEDEDEDDDDDEEDEDGDDDEDYDDEEEEEEQEEESLYDKVIGLIEEGDNIEALNVKECKAYLREHGLRVAGTKAVCMQRIIEHWRIRDGNGETFYPRSSFVVNCTGDVYKGDVLFEQKVYEKFNKVRRHGRILGKRTIVGRVVKESYGAAKQQHTFTVEVLWSKGTKKLPPLFPLLVKGRNLYKLRTLRQVLAEKHKRGMAARMVTAMRRKRRKTEAGNGEIGEHEAKCKAGSSKSLRRHPKPAHPARYTGRTCHSYKDTLKGPYQSQIQSNHRTKPFNNAGSTSLSPSSTTSVMLVTHYQGFNSSHHACLNPNYS